MTGFKIFLFYLLSSFLLASSGYYLLHLRSDYVFGVLFRMHTYHYIHPYQYILLVSVVYAVIATLAAAYFARRRKYKALLIILTMFSSVLLATIPGGMLWVYHDMQAGTFLTGDRLFHQLEWGAGMGIQVGWLIIALSIPYNLLGLIIGYFLTRFGFNKYANQRASQ